MRQGRAPVSLLETSWSPPLPAAISSFSSVLILGYAQASGGAWFPLHPLRPCPAPQVPQDHRLPEEAPQGPPRGQGEGRPRRLLASLPPPPPVQSTMPFVSCSTLGASSSRGFNIRPSRNSECLDSCRCKLCTSISFHPQPTRASRVPN